MAKYNLSIRKNLDGPIIYQFGSASPLPGYQVGDLVDLRPVSRGIHRIEKIAHVIDSLSAAHGAEPDHVFGLILDVGDPR